jgi:thioredoxin 2
MVDADDTNFAALTGGSRTVLVYLWAPWCAPCGKLGSAIEETARRHAGQLKVVRINVDHARRTVSRLRSLGVPTLLVMRDGEVVERRVGALSAPALRRWVADRLPGPAASEPAVSATPSVAPVDRPALLRALAIAGRGDYEEAAAELAILTAELAAADERKAALRAQRSLPA